MDPEKEIELLEIGFKTRVEQLKKAFLELHPEISGVKIRLQNSYSLKKGKKYPQTIFNCTINNKTVYLGNIPSVEKFKAKIEKAKKNKK